MKKLAILLPTYNAALYIKESIDSILNQTFSDFELYVYDDCSSDNTAEIVATYKDKRVFYRKNTENLGISRTLNKGLDELLPHFEFIARMDADDWAYPNRLEKQLYFLKANNEIAMCGTQGYWLKNIEVNPNKGWTYPTNSSYVKYNLLFSATFGHSSLIFRSNFFNQYQLRYSETISTCEDWDLWIRIQNIGKSANLDEFLMKYRILESSNHRSKEKQKLHLQERALILSNYWKKFDVQFSPQDILEFFYEEKKYSKKEFLSKLKDLIQGFNKVYFISEKEMSIDDKLNFRYLLSRKILVFWKNSGMSKFDIVIWTTILKEVKFESKLKLFKNLIR